MGRIGCITWLTLAATLMVPVRGLGAQQRPGQLDWMTGIGEQWEDDRFVWSNDSAYRAASHPTYDFNWMDAAWNPFRFTSAMQPPVQPPIQPQITPEVSVADPVTPQPGDRRVSPEMAERAEAIRGVSGGEATTAAEGTRVNAPDTASLLRDASTTQTVNVQRRSPVSFNPHIRGYKGGQIYSQAGGAYWTPAREDLDTMLSKIDPGMIQDVVVLPGPYGLRYGPGIAFIDVIRAPTPRYDTGHEIHFDTALSYRPNGDQFYGRETVFGGGSDFGYRFSYGARRGDDYQAGNGLRIPSSYFNQDFWGELSYDINPHQRVDFAYQRLDQARTDYPGQFFDIDNLGSYGFEGRIVDTNPMGPWSRLTLEGWYNHTRFRGSTAGKDRRDFPELARVNFALNEYFDRDDLFLRGDTHGAVGSSGARAAMRLGDIEETSLNLGADFRYLEQRLREDFEIVNLVEDGYDPEFHTNMPTAWMVDPGLFAEWQSRLADRWTLSLGGRVDFVRTTARAGDLRRNPETGHSESALPADALTQHDTLYAFYLTNRFDLNDHWALTGGFGHGQRPPTLVERYADGLFLGVMQSGYTRVIGDPNLKPERAWQMDLGLSVDHEFFRATASLFHSWILDYVPFNDDTVFQFEDARLLRYMNTDLATLTGFEVKGEIDFTRRVTPYGRMGYAQGHDQTLGAPLPAMSPVDSAVGLRLHDVEKGRHWGVDLETRMVASQDRIGWIRIRDAGAPIEERTPGFTVFNIRGYWNYTENLSLIAGIENVFDRNYQEHLDLRLRGPDGFPHPTTRVLAPGFSPYFSLRWVF